MAALAVVTGAWFLGPANWQERLLFGAGAIALLVTTPPTIGMGLVAIFAGALQIFRRRRASPSTA